MPFTLTMPKLSPTMEEGVIAKWFKSVGDFVEAGDILIEVSTDKATIEYEVLDEGYLREIIVSEGEDAKVNEAIAIFTVEKDESIEGYQPEGIVVEEAPAATEGNGAPAEEKKEGKTKKAAPAVTAGGLQQPAFAPPPPIEDYRFPKTGSEGRVKASPLAKRLAKKQGYDITTAKGSGPGGRIMKRDLETAQKKGTLTFGSGERPKHKPGEYVEEELSPMRKVIAQRLQEAKTFIPHFYVTQKIDVESMMEVREQLKSVGIKVSFNDFIVRAAALALREHPIINSGFNTVNNTITRYKTIDIGVAVSLEEGLITPILRHADYKNLGEISTEIKTLAARARKGSLEPHEYQGGSFTVSNLGMYGITEFAAIVNPPQGAILAVSGIEEVPVVKKGEVVPGKVMQVTLSSDHRVIDGAAAAAFLKRLQELLEGAAVLLV